MERNRQSLVNDLVDFLVTQTRTLACSAVVLGATACCESSTTEPPSGESVSLPSCASARASLPAAPSAPMKISAHVAATPPRADSRTFVRMGTKAVPLPQDAKPDALFTAALGKVEAEAVTGALLICRVTTSTKVGEDLMLRVHGSLPGAVQIESNGAEQDDTVIFSLPGITLKKGDRITLRGAIIQSKCHVAPMLGFLPLPVPACTETKTPVGSVSMVYEGGLPIASSGAGIQAECRGWNAIGVESQMPNRIANAQSDIDEFCKGISIDTTSASFGWPAVSDNDIPTGLVNAAALAGWADPRIKALVRYQSALHREWTEELGKWAAVQAQRGPAPGTDVPWYSGTSAKVVGPVDCSKAATAKFREARDNAGAGKSACIMRLELKATAGDGGAAAEVADPQMQVVTPSGTIASAYRAEILVNGKPVDSASDVRLAGPVTATDVRWVVLPKAAAESEGPLLVRALDGFDARLFRVR